MSDHAQAGSRGRYLSPLLDTFSAYEQPLRLVRGKGCTLWDDDGRSYLDMMAQNVCVSVGYGNERVTTAIEAQLRELNHCTTVYHHPLPALYAERLVATLPPGDWVVHLVNSGAEAIDLAVLTARVATGREGVVALDGAYHGTHFVAASATGISGFHHVVGQAPHFRHVACPLREQDNTALAEMDAAIDGDTAAFLVEPIQGYGGIRPIPDDYIRAASAKIREQGSLLIVDEVQTGFGRTGEGFWGFQRLGDLQPDIVVTSKGIGNGYPLAAVILRRDLAIPVARAKFFNTYGAGPVACAAGLAVLDEIHDRRLIEAAAARGRQLLDGLQSIARSAPSVLAVRGRGLLAGIEVAASDAANFHERFRQAGIVVGRCGLQGEVLKINPPLVITQDEVGRFLATAIDVLGGTS